MRKFLLLISLVFCFSVMQAQVYFQDDFNTGINAGNWTVNDLGNTNDTWYGTVGGFVGQTIDGTEFAFVNSDAGGSGPIYLHEELVSTPFNTAGAVNLILEFDHYFRHVASTDSGFVEIFDGNFWVPLDTFTASTGLFGAPSHEQYNITAYANANMQLQFIYDDDTSWAWYWAVDNVQISTPPSEDAKLNSLLSPSVNGRLSTLKALGTTEAVSIEISNMGNDTLFNLPVFFRLDNGIPIGETFAGPLPPGDTGTYTFTSTINLSNIGAYDLEVWTSVLLDLNLSNDSAYIRLHQYDNPARQLPLCQDFEMTVDTSIRGNFVGLPGVEELDMTTSDQITGHLQTQTGFGFANSGSKAITLDKSPGGGITTVNRAFLTYNLAAYDASNSLVQMDLAVMEHSDEVHSRDSIWIRGCETCTWIDIANWNDLTGNSNGQYFFLTNFNVSSALLAHGQNFSSTFQIQVGQEDNLSTVTTTGSDGMTFDDLCLSILADSNGAVTRIVNPLNQACGDSSMVLEIEVSNNGNDSLVNILVGAQITGFVSANLTGTIPGPLAPGQSINFTFPGTFNSYTGGNIDVVAWTDVSGDVLTFDDTLAVNLDLTAVPGMPVVTGDSLVCVGTMANFAIQNPVANHAYSWYDSIGGSPIGDGANVSLGPINGPTTYYAQSGGTIYQNIGRVDNSGQGAAFLTYTAGLVFDVFQEINIDSMVVYPFDTGMVSVIILDNLGDTVGTQSVLVEPVTTGARITIPVNLPVLPGLGYQVNAEGSTCGGLFRNSAGSVYPYVLPNVMEINATINNLQNSGYYYFFYDWKIRTVACTGPYTVINVDTFAFSPTTAQFNAAANGLAVAFSDGSVNAQSWEWDFGDGNFSSQQNPNHSFSLPGTYTVCLIANGDCESDTICNTVNLNCNALVAGFVALDTFHMVHFSDTNASAMAWVWDFGDGATDSIQNPVHSYSSDGTFLVCLTTWDACGDSISHCDSITVCAFLGAVMGVNPNGGNGLTYDFSDFSLGNVTQWEWDFGDGNTSILQNPSHSFLSGGAFTVTLVIHNICGQTDTISQSLVVVGLENQLAKSLMLYPNPNQGVFWLELKDWPFDLVEVELLDLMGKGIWQGKFEQNGSFKQKIATENSAAGTYLLRVKSGGLQVNKKLVVY